MLPDTGKRVSKKKKGRGKSLSDLSVWSAKKKDENPSKPPKLGARFQENNKEKLQRTRKKKNKPKGNRSPQKKKNGISNKKGTKKNKKKQTTKKSTRRGGTVGKR